MQIIFIWKIWHLILLRNGICKQWQHIYPVLQKVIYARSHNNASWINLSFRAEINVFVRLTNCCIVGLRNACNIESKLLARFVITFLPVLLNSRHSLFVSESLHKLKATATSGIHLNKWNKSSFLS